MNPRVRCEENRQSHTSLDGEFGLRTAATSVSRISVAAELDLLAGSQRENVLEALADTLQALASIFAISALVLAALGRLASSSRPQTDTPEGLTYVHHNAHDFVVTVVLEHLANRGKHDVEPSLVVCLAALESVRPTASVLVLWILPLWADAGLEEVVVGLLGELRGRSDVVLRKKDKSVKASTIGCCGQERSSRRFPRTPQRCQS